MSQPFFLSSAQGQELFMPKKYKPNSTVAGRYCNWNNLLKNNGTKTQANRLSKTIFMRLLRTLEAPFVDSEGRTIAHYQQ